MKNLANCTIREFAAQTALMADSLEKWLQLTDFMNIRRSVPELPEIPAVSDPPTPEEIKTREKALKERKAIIKDAAVKNCFALIRSALKDHTEETLEVVAYACFIPLSEIDNYKMTDILKSIAEMIRNEDVLDFFVSLKELEDKIGS